MSEQPVSQDWAACFSFCRSCFRKGRDSKETLNSMKVNLHALHCRCVACVSGRTLLTWQSFVDVLITWHSDNKNPNQHTKRSHRSINAVLFWGPTGQNNTSRGVYRSYCYCMSFPAQASFAHHAERSVPLWSWLGSAFVPLTVEIKANSDNKSSLLQRSQPCLVSAVFPLGL